jgi:predicted adenine nucleotide alpha hydrolase (AANH) superfamily ATPase
LGAGCKPHAFFFNPNIYPSEEAGRRLETVEYYNRVMEIELTIEDIEEDFTNLVGDVKGRCNACYRLRLSRAAEFAAENGFQSYTSSLLYSKYQNHDAIKSIADECAELYGIRFYYEVYRLGWYEGIKRSKELGMYRQKYCGCRYSFNERTNGVVNIGR